MKLYYIILFVVAVTGYTNKVAAQLSKPVIDSSAFDQWSALVGSGEITGDGNYVSYVQRDGRKETTIIRSATGSWQRKLPVGNVKLLDNNKQAIYQGKDTLYFIGLGTDKTDFITGVQSMELFSCHNQEWLFYKLKKDSGKVDLRVWNTATKKDISIGNINDYYFFKNSVSLLLVQPKMQRGKVISNTLTWYDAIHHHTTPAFSIDGSMPQLLVCKVADAFCYPKVDSLGHTNALLYYEKGMPDPITLVDNSSITKLDTNLVLVDWGSALTTFMKDGRHICFQVKEKNPKAPATHESKVTIWRYNDQLLPIEQRVGIRTRTQFRWSVSVEDNKLVPFENSDIGLISDPAECSDYLVCKKWTFDDNTFWQKNARFAISVISVNDGKQTIIADQAGYVCNSSLSPEEKYIIYYIPALKNYFCFDINSGETKNFTAALDKEWTTKNNSFAPCFTCGIGIAAWTFRDQAVLIYADYDIWKFDLRGMKPPVNITNGLGERNHIHFRIAKEMNPTEEKLILTDNRNLLLYAFDSVNKKSGFYSKKINVGQDPLLLSMDNYAYSQPGANDLALQKAKKAPRWIIKRENASYSPNLFYTIDFKNFFPLSDVHPEKNYNWLTNELITWKLPDGQYSQGILYKPNNFDSSQKYPVIFEYYEERSDELNQFIEPRYSRDRINIPYFVSQGYLIFVPDIHYMTANVGESALNSVLSAARHLLKYTWIDSTKMGLHGHSFGGGETNYIITHSAFFAAACEAAGPADAISSYGSLRGHGPNMYQRVRNDLYEISQQRMHASLAEIPEAYIKASPVLNTANVTTPLLMMHNQNDGNVPWGQAVEFFTGLKRMGKRVWMLEYEGAGHGLIGNDKAAKDYNTRMLQFFDHYLKGAPLPQWMLEDGGLSYNLDSIAPEPEEKEVLYKGKYQKVNQTNSSSN